MEGKAGDALPSTGFMVASCSNVATHPAAPAKEKTTATCKAWRVTDSLRPRVEQSSRANPQQGEGPLKASSEDGNPLLLNSRSEK